jgi:hypothetical protein
MKTFLAVLAAAAVLFLVLTFLPRSLSDTPADAAQGLPWQIDVLPDGTSRVFGLTIGTSTLADARARFGNEGDLAIVAAPGESGTVEAFYGDVALGVITGKLVLTAEMSEQLVESMWQRARKVEYMRSSTKKATLTDEDADLAERAPIRAIAFIPTVNLDQDMVLQRFGRPTERIRSSEVVEHFLYPDRGLDIILDSEGKELLQYVAPQQFERLRAPLLKPQTTNRAE